MGSDAERTLRTQEMLWDRRSETLTEQVRGLFLTKAREQILILQFCRPDGLCL